MPDRERAAAVERGEVRVRASALGRAGHAAADVRAVRVEDDRRATRRGRRSTSSRRPARPRAEVAEIPGELLVCQSWFPAAGWSGPGCDPTSGRSSPWNSVVRPVLVGVVAGGEDGPGDLSRSAAVAASPSRRQSAMSPAPTRTGSPEAEGDADRVAGRRRARAHGVATTGRRLAAVATERERPGVHADAAEHGWTTRDSRIGPR